MVKGHVAPIVTEKDWLKVRPELETADVVVDALFGTGLRGPITGLPALAITDLNKTSGVATLPTPALILAVDTPSGLLSDGEYSEGPIVRAHETVTFTAPKIGQLISGNASASGKLHVRWIGSPSKLIEETGKGALRWAGPDEFAAIPLVRAAD